MPAQLAYSAKPAAVPAAMFARAHLAGEEPRGLHASGPVQHFTPDQEIYAEGDDCDTLFKLVSGVVRTCKFSSDGRRQIDAFYVVGDIFGLEAGAEHSLSAEAVSDCTVIAYRRQNFRTLSPGDGELSHQLLSCAMINLARAQDHALLLGRRSAVEKVAAFLMGWAESSADQRSIALAMTRQDIADYLGLTIETVSRTLSQFERDGLIEMPTARQIRLKNAAAMRHFNA